MCTSPLNDIVIIIQNFNGLFIFLCSNWFFFLWSAILVWVIELTWTKFTDNKIKIALRLNKSLSFLDIHNVHQTQSYCVFEHVGSIQKLLALVEVRQPLSPSCLVHFLKYNCMSQCQSKQPPDPVQLPINTAAWSSATTYQYSRLIPCQYLSIQPPDSVPIPINTAAWFSANTYQYSRLIQSHYLSIHSPDPVSLPINTAPCPSVTIYQYSRLIQCHYLSIQSPDPVPLPINTVVWSSATTYQHSRLIQCHYLSIQPPVPVVKLHLYFSICGISQASISCKVIKPLNLYHPYHPVQTPSLFYIYPL